MILLRPIVMEQLKEKALKIEKVDFMDLIVDDLIESLLPFPRALNVAFGDTSEAKDGFDILVSNLGN